MEQEKTEERAAEAAETQQEEQTTEAAVSEPVAQEVEAQNAASETEKPETPAETEPTGAPEAAEQCSWFARYKMTLLCCALILALGVMTAVFYIARSQDAREKVALHDQLLQAQKQVESLRAENEELAGQLEAVSVFAPEEGGQLEEIPFEVDLEDWNYILVNDKNPLKKEFSVTLKKTWNGQRVDERIVEPLEEMLSAAEAEGLRPMICSSYRDYRKQDQLMDQSIARYMRSGLDYTAAFFKMRERIAPTGASEHHTGLAVDIVAKSYQGLDSKQASTKETLWLKEHAAEYGFIVRYPADKAALTGIEFESWHYRYVGKEAAAYMVENDLCLEEFVELVKQQQERAQQEKKLQERTGA